jgi:SAM-dependent methyltransferase
MSLATEYNDWHQRVYDAGPAHADEESPWYRLVSEYLVPLKGKRVLEVACGRGGFANRMAAMGAVTFGTDFSATALQIARGKSVQNGGVRLELIQADAQNLPYADESFDVVVSCETIEHLPHPCAALKEMARICRAGGLLYLTTPNYFNAMGLYYFYARLRDRPATPGSDQPTDHVFWFPGIRAMLKQAGWAIICADGTIHQFPIWPGHNPVAIPSLELNRSVRRILSPLAFHYFVMARKNRAR